MVDEVGEGVTGVSEGDDVFGRGQNTQAEYAVLDAWAAKSPSIDWAVAAAAGVGAVAVQMAVGRGARVIASASEANQDYLREIRVLSIANFAAGQAGARVTGGDA